MITIKSEKEISLMKKAGQILAEAKIKLENAVRPGITTNELNKIFHNYVISKGGKLSFLGYMGFTKSICTSVNEEMIHGIPSNRKLKNKDLLKIDMGVIFQGYHVDSAFSISVGESTPENEKLIKIAERAFWKGVSAIKPGARIGDIGAAIGDFVNKHGYYVPTQFTGHGIGSALHEEPYVPNYGSKGTGALLKNGMVICIEPMILQGSNNCQIKTDGWTVVSNDMSKTSHFEHTILIKNGYPEILTGGKNGK